jgi:type II secretory pathway component PulF
LFGFVALVAFVLLTLLQLYGLNLLAVLLIGVLAGVFATSGMRRGSGVGRGLTTGLIGGLIMLLGSLFVGILLISFFRSQINVWLAGLPFIDAVPVVGDTVSDTIGEVNERAEPWLRGGGLALGGCLGIVNLLLMTFGGALGGAVRRR